MPQYCTPIDQRTEEEREMFEGYEPRWAIWCEESSEWITGLLGHSRSEFGAEEDAESAAKTIERDHPNRMTLRVMRVDWIKDGIAS